MLHPRLVERLTLTHNIRQSEGPRVKSQFCYDTDCFRNRKRSIQVFVFTCTLDVGGRLPVRRGCFLAH